ncbi:MAG: TetR/AcrR family transcriptional regulator [Desulfatibacillum sp.]|nr:TetR/AcrR family transcriptional regulator [Desulfatibacillum sp.]
MDKQDKHKSICRKRKEREKKQRIQSILDAAKKVFASKGYLKSTMDEIAMAAEITKPTIYLYFKSKDDLILSLMQPLIDDSRSRLEIVEKELLSGAIKNGRDLVTGIFQAFYHGYEILPETFRVVQLFQQKDLICELRPEIRATLDENGRGNIDLCRRMLARGIEMELIKPVNVYEMVDVIWALIVGVIQLEDCKGDEQKDHRLKKKTLDLAQRLIVEALTRNAEQVI